MRRVALIWLVFPMAAVLGQWPRDGIWWKDCELDVRYSRAYDPDRTYGRISAMGGWKVDEVSELAKSGDACMQYIRGRIYAYDGVPTNINLSDVPRDWGQAAKWWRLAAEQGHGDAQLKLAGLYWQGSGVIQDYVEAAGWYRKAAEQGMPCAQLSLGDTYRDAQGVPKDKVQAHMWMNLAAAHNTEHGEDYCVETAGKEREILAATMSSGQVAEAQRRAREWKGKTSPDPIRHRTFEK